MIWYVYILPTTSVKWSLTLNTRVRDLATRDALCKNRKGLLTRWFITRKFLRLEVFLIVVLDKHRWFWAWRKQALLSLSLRLLVRFSKHLVVRGAYRTLAVAMCWLALAHNTFAYKSTWNRWVLPLWAIGSTNLFSGTTLLTWSTCTGSPVSWKS